MAKEVSKVTIYVNQDVQDIIKAKQMDANSRFLEVTLLHDDGRAVDLTGHIVRFNARKSDYTVIFNNCEILDAPGGVFLVEFTDQTLAIGDSTVVADISVHTEDERTILTTRAFNIYVQATLRDVEAIESSNEFNAVVILFQDVYDLRVMISAIRALIGNPEDGASEVWGKAGETVFAAVNALIAYVKENGVAGLVDKINRIVALLGIANPSEMNSDTIMNFLNMIMNKSTVKSRQMGVHAGVSSASNISISISAVNPEKCLVFLNQSKDMSYIYYMYMPTLVSISATRLIVTTSAYYNGSNDRWSAIPFTWEVVELN